MIRIYKLSYNYNSVEFSIDEDELASNAFEDEMVKSVDEETGETKVMYNEDAIIERILQREYDILQGIEQTREPAAPPKPIEPPSESQIRWAKNLGMVDPEKRSRQEVGDFIQKHRK
jgi:hypothetical protein